MTAAKNQLSAQVLREALQLYPEWRQQVKQGTIKPSVRPAKDLINTRLCGGGRTETTAPKGMQALHKLWALKAVQEGLLKINPQHSRGKPLYLVIGSES